MQLTVHDRCTIGLDVPRAQTHRRDTSLAPYVGMATHTDCAKHIAETPLDKLLEAERCKHVA
jgi:hypothetical protein